MLFILAVDVFQRLVMAADILISKPISRSLNNSILALQYADDTAIVANADLTCLMTLKLALRIFTMVSGLHINFGKSAFIPMNLNEDKIQLVSLVLGCARTDMPTSYLGMPLSYKKPTRHEYFPLLEKIERRLQGWHGKLLSRGGRLQLIISVITSIPIYLMTCFFLPKWVIKKIERLCRKFMWGKNDDTGKGVPLLNWNEVCVPKKFGGLGVPNLETRNISLLLRWWWKAYQEPNGLWGCTIQKIRRVNIRSTGPLIWKVGGSFFWQNLFKIKHFFHWSAQWSIGTGEKISYWYDSWDEPSIRFFRDGEVRPKNQAMSLREAYEFAFRDQDVDIEDFFPEQEDSLVWRWSSTGIYSAGSFYKMFLAGGKTRWGFMEVWNSYAPAKVKKFSCLFLKERILTHDLMLTRGMMCELKCPLCEDCVVETAVHLMFYCVYATRVWDYVQLRTGLTLLIRGDTVGQTWHLSSSTATGGARGRRLWATRFMVVLWHVWKQRNEAIFRGLVMHPAILASKIIEEMGLWVRFCRPIGASNPSRAMGLGIIRE